jgi:asparagine synthase (glutamine-hydrolysing)
VCGINGIFHLRREGNFVQQVRGMNRAMAHRGPDDEGIFEAPGLALGHRRLSIIDLSAAGHQPMHFSNERYTIVYNGEMYNFRELKKELPEFSFTTQTDTEVILAAYAKWESASPDKLNGMFAFAIWDKTEQKLFVARDRLGIKPLYWSVRDDHFLFASELRCLLSTGLIPKQADEAALTDYLRYQTVHAPATIIRGVHMLLPGHCMEISSKGVEIKAWWKPQVRDAGKKTYKETCSDIRNLFRASVERRLIADVPFGAFLSGGIDSTAVVGMMQEVASSKVKTFSVVFDDSEFSETVYARQVAKKFGTEHHEIQLKPEDFLKQLPAALDAMDHPSGDGPNTYVVSGETKKAGITVALSGLGGDELFAGYEIFRRAFEMKDKRWLNNFPRGMRSAGGSLVKMIRPGMRGEKIAAVLELEKIGFSTFYPLSRQVLLEQQVADLFNGTKHGELVVHAITKDIEREFPGENHLISRVSIAEITTYMQNVLLRDTDQMSMAHALEVRVPFLDYNLVEYVLDLPDEYKFPETPKKLLTDALGTLIPPEIVNRPKMGFTFPWKNWMKQELKGFCEERLANLAKRKSFNSEPVMQMWKSFLADDPRVTWSRVWPLVVLSHWLDKNDIEA